MDTKDQILRLWLQTERPGVEQLCSWLEASDFFWAPASRNHHLACVGGLAQHSLAVYKLLVDKVCYYIAVDGKRTLGEVDSSSLKIIALGHDLCKVNYYKEGGEHCSDKQYDYMSSLVLLPRGPEYKDKIKRSGILDEFGKVRRNVKTVHASIIIDWLKNHPADPMPELPAIWSVDDQLPLGHGEKSLSILQDFIKLTDEEKAVVRWHMGMTDPGTHFSYPTGRSYNTAKEKYPLLTLLECADQEATHILERKEE